MEKEHQFEHEIKKWGGCDHEERGEAKPCPTSYRSGGLIGEKLSTKTAGALLTPVDNDLG